MSTKTSLLIALVGIYLLVAPADAEAQSPVASGWTEPLRLSDTASTASEASVVADDYGFVHVFWSEVLDDEHSKLKYTRYDGNTWNSPVDIRYSEPLLGAKSISPFVDGSNTLHLAWISGQNGPAYYTKAPANAALTVQAWADERVIRVPANVLALTVDQSGTLHLVYQAVTDSPSRPGVYYVRSTDEGQTWTDPIWLDPDIPPGMIPRTVRLGVDDTGGLHAIWFYVSTVGTEGDWIRYARSRDGGQSWSAPFTLAKNSEGDAHLNPSAMPVMAVRGQAVHVVWGAGDLLYRHHRYSLDGGSSWSQSKRIFGNLNGQAFEGLAFDGVGRLHFIGQIRYPVAIYHAMWEGDDWTRPEPIYTIVLGSNEPIPEGIVAAHHTHPVFRNGIELVVTFADPPPADHRQLFVFSHTLTDILVAPPKSTPTPVPFATLEGPTSTPTPLPTSTPASLEGNGGGGQLASQAGSPQLSVGIGALIVTSVFTLALFARFLLRYQRA